MTEYDAKVNSIQKDTTMPAGEKAQAIEALNVQFETENSEILLGMSEGKRGAIEKLFARRSQLATDVATGKLEGDAAKIELERIQNEEMLLAMNDPILAKAYTVSKFNLEGLATMAGQAGFEEARQKFGEYILSNGEAEGNAANLFDRSPAAQKALGAYFKTLSAAGGDANPEAQVQLKTHLSNVVLGLEDYSSLYARDPKAAMSLVEWMATPEFLSLRQSNPEAFTNVDSAVQSLQINFNDEVWGMVQSEFKKGQVQYPPTYSVGEMMALSFGGGALSGNAKEGTSKPTPSAVTYEFGAAGIRFKPMDPADKEAKATAN